MNNNQTLIKDSESQERESCRVGWVWVSHNQGRTLRIGNGLSLITFVDFPVVWRVTQRICKTFCL